jgi:RNA polymerase sigma-70 factor (ECF subfamily)
MTTTAGELFERHHVGLYRYFLRMTGSRDVAEDLTQELFLRVVRHVRNCTPGREVQWMFQIARNLVVDYRRERSNRPVALSETPRTGTEARQLVAFGLAEAVGMLSDSDREVFLLREVNGLSYPELAAACETTPENVRSRVCRARLRLRELLNRRLSSDAARRRTQED